VDEAYLTDADIAQPDIITVAEANIIEQIPDYASLTGNKRTWLEAATVCECALLLCLSMAARLPTREQGPHFTQEITIDWDKKRQEIEVERNSYIGRVVGFTTIAHLRYYLSR
jgi:hypothetical protein